MPPFRWPADLLLVWTLCGLALMSGCASTPLGKRLAGGEQEPVISEKNLPVSQEKPEEQALDETDKSKAKPPSRERSPAIADSSSTRMRPLDPATQALIDSELKELPAAERKRWRTYLSSIKPSQIPNVLQARTQGIVPPELAAAAETADSESPPETRVATQKKNTKKFRVEPNAEPETPDREVPQVAGEDEQDISSDGIPAMPIGLDESGESDGEMIKTTSAELNAPPTEKSPSDGSKFWQTGKRGDRSITDRLSAGRLAPLAPPWSRDPRSPEEKSPKTKPVAPSQKAIVTAQIEDSVRPDPQSDYWQDELKKLISLMEAEASRPAADDSPAERQAHIQRQVYLRMLYLMAAEPEKAQLPIVGVEAVDQEFWTSMFWGMSNYFDDEQTGDPGTRAAQTIAQLNSAARQLQSVADLELRNVSFCQHIDGWGLYDRFDHDEFQPGQAVLLYGEIRNFSTEATAAGMYRTLVSSTIEIVKTGQEDVVLERNDLGVTEDQCRGLRSDFYNSYRIDLPAHLTPGSYQLRLTVEDKLNGRSATQTIGLTIR